jgi:DMSO reductase anchor subunit
MGTAEFPLVLFTLLTQMAIGLALVSATRQWAVVEGPSGKIQAEWLAVAGLLAVGVIAAFFHLGHPLGAIQMLNNLDTAWLSREILGMIVFGLLVAGVLWMVYKGSLNGWLLKLTALVGLVAVFATGMTYAAPALVAVENPLPIVFFLLTSVILGAAGASYFTPAGKQPLVTAILVVGLIVALVVYLVVPFIWLSGSTVTRMTGQAYLASPLHWTHIIVGLVVPLAVLAWLRKVPAWLPLLILIGEFAGRMAFFALTVSSAANLGGLY